MTSSRAITDPERDAIWRGWEEKNCLQDAKSADLAATLTKLAAAAVLLITAAYWNYAGSFHIFVRFAVCAGAARVALLAAAERKYPWAILFAAMAALYNPVFPAFGMSGRLDLFIVFASAAAFAASWVAQPKVGEALS